MTPFKKTTPIAHFLCSLKGEHRVRRHIYRTSLDTRSDLLVHNPMGIAPWIIPRHALCKFSNPMHPSKVWWDMLHITWAILILVA
jgi:hypothetical protein